jgi:hypothetical protein
MKFFRSAKISAFRTRLQVAETERCDIVQIVSGSQVNLAQIADRVDRVEYEIRALTKELKLLELPEPEEESW